MKSLRPLVVSIALLFLVALPAYPHCDRADGPVVADGRAALAAGSIDGALKWVGPEQEGELKDAFALATTVRGADANAKKLADRYFLETLVRLHRAMEGEPYDGIKWQADPLPPAMVHADKALAEGELGNLGAHLGSAVNRSVTEKFNKALEAKARAGESAEAGRRYTAAYVDYIRYVETLEHAMHAKPHGH
jgi:hypothetical protein